MRKVKEVKQYNQRKEDADMKMMELALKKAIKKRYNRWGSVKSFFKYLFIWIICLVVFGILMENPISLVIICGTIILAILIFKLTS